MPVPVPVFRAASHFGLGPRPGELETVAGLGPRQWLRAQLAEGLPVPDAVAAIPPSSATLTDMREHERRRAMMRAAAAAAADDAADTDDASRDTVAKVLAEMVPQLGARLRAAVETPAPFRERLVHFWSNHFTVSTAGARQRIATSCVGFENEAIRPSLDGRFDAMLLRVARHPVMLLYLDNAGSISPESPVGRRAGRGLNENLAREILELHSLGVNGGYGQRDVEALARLISGWSVAGPDDAGAAAGAPGAGSGMPGTFRFRKAGHAPGPVTLLGRDYPQPGLARGEAALADLANHPATAAHLARKLAVHFVADRPEPSAVAHIEGVWRETNGHLPSVHAALIDLPGVLEGPATKLRSPWEFMIAALRGLDVPQVPERSVLGSLRTLGQFPFQAPSPAGWPDALEDWGSPNALLQRVDWAHQLAVRVGSLRKPAAQAAFMLPPDADAAHDAVAAAESAEQGLALLVGAPAFQWR